MKMKKSELKEADIKKFKQRLEEMRRQILGQLSAVSEEVQVTEASGGYSQHQADEGTDDFDRTISIELSSKEQKVLRQIDRALEKITEGNYGICDVTEEPIPKARLEAIPHATMTVKAQEQMEREQF
jgi:DnaK suppressor protein